VVEEINISKIAVSKISFDDTNPNILTKEQMKSLKLVMEKFGFLAPVILNKDLQVIDGEHRVRVYQELGKKTIPAYVIDVNTINKKMLRQLMNKLRGEHDKQKDAEEFKLIFEAGKLNEFSNLLAAQTEDFQAILEKKFDIGFERAEEQEVPEPPTKPKAKLGDIYQLGKHRIMCGDSTNQTTIKQLMTSKAKITFTSPPYNMGKNARVTDRDADSKYANSDDNIKNYATFLINFTINCLNESDYVFIDIQQLANNKIEFIEYLYELRNYFVDRLIWDKEQVQPALAKNIFNSEFEDIIVFKDEDKPSRSITSGNKFHGTINNVYKGKPQKNNDVAAIHKATFPLHLPQFIIKNFTIEDDIVLDPFLGSGTSLIACEQTGRICYGMELDPVYIDVIITRWENYTGKKAKKV
jgi:DNA modification methylase